MSKISFIKKYDFYKKPNFLNWIVVILAIIIGSASMIYTRNLVDKLKDREKRLIELYAKTLEYTANETNIANITFLVQEIMLPNNSIPVVWTDGIGNPLGFRNLDIEPVWNENEQNIYVREQLEIMKKENEPIQINFRDEEGLIYDYQYVYYRNSELLLSLEYFPILQLLVIALFGLIVFAAFNSSKAAEQNRVWVGLAKETAHQLGTPISSLMAWIEYFRADDELKEKEILVELEKDIHRLETITQRFSNIGSAPVLNHENIFESIQSNLAYLRKRISKKVEITLDAMPKDIRAKINKPLFDWVIENIIKNAVDSMAGAGHISIKIRKSTDDKIFIDVKDSGKGIHKSKLKEVFNPGYTTKQRGWGLGLTLAKRIIENYHEGKIYVKNSELNEGTTFRIVLRTNY